MLARENFTADLVVQYSIVGLVFLAACVWMIWKIVKRNKRESGGSCCGCGLADHCNKKNYGNSKNLQQQHCRESGGKGS